jgi:hypothetical protein
MRFLFPLIAFPHRDHVPRFTARRPDNHDHPTRKEANYLKALLAVVRSQVLLRICLSRENFSGVDEIQPSLSQRRRALVRIEGDLHLNYCTPNK